MKQANFKKDNMKKIGRFRNHIPVHQVSQEYSLLSESDEDAARILAEKGYYSQACYYVLQAMEKALRAKIFVYQNPENKYFRDLNCSHSLENAVNVLLSLARSEIVREQISQQISNFVLGERTKYAHLHNNLRYPHFYEKDKCHRVLEVDKQDYQELLRRLDLLRFFLKDIDILLMA